MEKTRSILHTEIAHYLYGSQMIEKNYYTQLYQIASHLNKEYSLPAALHRALEKTVEILDVETGWIWLTEPDHKSVYLAASYQLPPALRQHPERLSGWCYCIKQYLSDDMDQAVNISEIKCSRLEDVNTDTKGLKFHATIPLWIGDQKVGLMNLLSKESRQLTDEELTVLNTVSELVSSAIARTRLQQSFHSPNAGDSTIQKVLKRVIEPELTALTALLQSGQFTPEETLQKVKELQYQLSSLTQEMNEKVQAGEKEEFLYPEMPLTKRELEVLGLIKQGHTNGHIGEQLYIAERTVKFHVTSILSKLHAKTRTEAVDISLKRGLI